MCTYRYRWCLPPLHIPPANAFHRDCIQVLEFYISQERDFFGFITHIRAEYNTWLGTEGQSKFLAVSMKGTLTDTLQEVHSYKCVHSNLLLWNQYPPILLPQGLDFVDTVYNFCKVHSFHNQLRDSECKKWVQLLLQLVDVTGDDPCTNLKIFLGKSTHTVVVKEYRDDIIKHVSAAEITWQP